MEVKVSINFNPDPGKLAKEVLFSRKLREAFYPILIFNNAEFLQTNSQSQSRLSCIRFQLNIN